MAQREVRTQEELDDALSAGDYPVCVGDGIFTLRGSARADLRSNSRAVLQDSARVVLRDNSSAILWGKASAVLWNNSSADLQDSARAVLQDSARADLRGSARAVLRGSARAVLQDSARVVLRDSAHAVLWGSAHADLRNNARADLRHNARADLRDNASAVLWNSSSAVLWNNSSAILWGKASAVLFYTARAVLRDNAHADLRDSASAVANGHSIVRVFSRDAKVTAGSQVIVALHCESVNIIGGVVVRQTMPQSAAEWCAHYGVEVKDGVAILFKGVDAEFRSPNGASYQPGTIPVAPDWDGGELECGGGLHFLPHAAMARDFIGNPAHFIACPVALTDIAVHPDGAYPQKVKARGCCAPVWECDEEGKRI